MNSTQSFGLGRWIAAWFVHSFTATGSIVGLMALYAIYQHQFTYALWLIIVTFFIDGIDGFMARKVRVDEVLPSFDGNVLDLIIDYFNYVVMPAFFVLTYPFMDFHWRAVVAGLMVILSVYWYGQKDQKTPDHFFKRFPCLWNIVIIYLFLWQASPATNLTVLAIFLVLTIVPIKFAHAIKLEYVIQSWWLKVALSLYGLASFMAILLLLWQFPKPNISLITFSTSYWALYFLIGVYRTLVPLKN